MRYDRSAGPYAQAPINMDN